MMARTRPSQSTCLSKVSGPRRLAREDRELLLIVIRNDIRCHKEGRRVRSRKVVQRVCWKRWITGAGYVEFEGGGCGAGL